MYHKHNLEWFKKNSLKGELEFFLQYEDEIRKLFKELGKIGAINMVFDESYRKRIEQIRWTINASGYLNNNVMAFTRLPEEERNKLEESLKKKGFKVGKDVIAYQMLSIMAHGYHTHLEDIKFTMGLIIDFDLLIQHLKISKTKFKALGWMISTLKKVSKDNNFLNFLDTGIRNAIAHMTYFYQDNKIHFCDNIFDEHPEQRTLVEFMIEAKQMNLLAIGFFLIYLDMFKKPT